MRTPTAASSNEIEKIQRVAVLGAGTMGGRIAAHIANAGYPVLLLDMVGTETRDRSSIARQALETLKKARPAALVSPSVATLVEIGNFEDDLHRLTSADWVIEAVAEQMSIKHNLMARVVPHLGSNAILSTNTSGLRVEEIASILPEGMRPRFLGVHFFNPPRYMALCEVIPTIDTNPEILHTIEHFSELHLGKTVVVAKDRPNFIANRIGTFSVMNTMRIMKQQGLSIEEVDLLTGAPLGWPKTGTFRLADLVGIDVLAHVAHNFALSTIDERADVTIDPMMDELVKRGILGDKTGQGFYKKQRDATGKEHRLVLNVSTMAYEPRRPLDFPELATVKASEPSSTRIPQLLREGPMSGRSREFYWPMLSELFAYAAHRIGEVSDSIADIDLAMQAGFNWQNGPFAMWDAAGVPETVARMRRLGQPVPEAADRLLRSGGTSWYRQDGSEYFDVRSNAYVPITVSPRVLSLPRYRRTGIVAENASVSLVDVGDGIACIEMHSKMNTFGRESVEFIRDVLADNSSAVRNFHGFIISNDAAHFSTGADLAEAVGLMQAANWNLIDQFIQNFQGMTRAAKFCSRPVIVAPFGMCLGGGAELSMHAAARQPHMELAIGLVETGVGLIPGGGGCKEMTLRAIEMAASVRADARGDSLEIHKTITNVFETIAMAKVSTSAVEAKRLHLLRDSDAITMNRAFLLADAKTIARTLTERGYTPLIPRTNIPSPGKPALALLELRIHTLREGDFISDHDVMVLKHTARVLCGGAVSAGTPVSEDHLLELEREAFLALCGEQKTQDRIVYTLKTGKPLRN